MLALKGDSSLNWGSTLLKLYQVMILFLFFFMVVDDCIAYLTTHWTFQQYIGMSKKLEVGIKQV